MALDWETIDLTGAELRSLGHRRSELVEAIQWAWERGQVARAAQLVAELGSVSQQCQELLDRQYAVLARALVPAATKEWHGADSTWSREW